MNREEAERHREELAAADPERTFIPVEERGGRWTVAEVGLEPSDPG